MRVLDPGKVEFEATTSGLLKVTLEDGTALERVYCISFFPLSDPDECATPIVDAHETGLVVAVRIIGAAWQPSQSDQFVSPDFPLSHGPQCLSENTQLHNCRASC